jgi:hypothetical protein
MTGEAKGDNVELTAYFSPREDTRPTEINTGAAMKHIPEKFPPASAPSDAGGLRVGDLSNVVAFVYD